MSITLSSGSDLDDSARQTDDLARLHGVADATQAPPAITDLMNLRLVTAFELAEIILKGAILVTGCGNDAAASHFARLTRRRRSDGDPRRTVRKPAHK